MKEESYELFLKPMSSMSDIALKFTLKYEHNDMIKFQRAYPKRYLEHIFRFKNTNAVKNTFGKQRNKKNSCI